MGRQKHDYIAILWVLILLSQSFQSCSWFFTSEKTVSSNKPSEIPENSHDVVTEFAMEAGNNKGIKLVEKAMRKAALSNTCWQNAYKNLFEGCSQILAAEEKRSKLAWHLTDCFQKETGRLSFPYCDVRSPMVNCLKQLDADAHRIYLEFYLETNSICHQLQADAFKRETERLVNELERSAKNAETKLENIEEQAEHLLHSSDQIHEYLVSIDIQTQQVAQTSKNVEEHVGVVLKHSQTVYQKSIEIADTQSELLEGQGKMKVSMDEGMAMLNDSANKLGVEINNLRNEAVEIEKDIGKVRDAMFTKMDTLQSKANDIEDISEASLDRQKELIDSQSAALEVLQTVTNFQSQALEESRGTLKQLIELGHNQQQELMARQEQLKEAHDHLVENSKTILAAQEIFESKQASLFLAIDKLFALHNAILLESRVIKAFLVYSILIFVLYMFTSTKQTYGVRPRLYIGLCLTFLIEFIVLRYGNDIEQQAWITSIIRLTYVLISLVQLLHAIYTFRDYESLNHQLLKTLIEKVNGMQGNKQLLWDEDSDVDWSLWVDTDLPEDELEDPDYMLPEEVGEASIVTTSVAREYNLRNRHCA